jgi:hypothetical protein
MTRLTLTEIVRAILGGQRSAELKLDDLLETARHREAGSTRASCYAARNRSTPRQPTSKLVTRTPCEIRLHG